MVRSNGVLREVLGCRTLVPALALAFAVAMPLSAFAQDRAVPQSETQVKLSFAPIVKKVAPAVVNVYANRTVVQRAPQSPFFSDPFFRQFFGDPGQNFGRPREKVMSSLGSGVIISSKGIVITNYHVIRGADQVRVALQDRREFDAKVVLKDERTDLAVLKIQTDKPETFPTVQFANSDNLQVGDIVLAIGNPFGVGQTVTQGIVSALARTDVGASDYQFFIQTDAAINPGNSGGALVDMNGKLVGINSAIYTRSGGSNGIGFAIPANMVRFVANAAEHGGTIRHPWLGASVQTVSSEIADAMGLDRPEGVLITNIAKDSPAAKAGLKVGDLVTKVDGEEVSDPNSFGYRFATKTPGTSEVFTYLRDGKEHETRVTVELAPETVPRDARTLQDHSPFDGATVMNLSPAVIDELALKTDDEGVVVATVKSGSIADRVGLRKGDIIMGVNNTKIKTTQQLQKVLSRGARTWALELKRDGQVSRILLRG